MDRRQIRPAGAQGLDHRISGTRRGLARRRLAARSHHRTDQRIFGHRGDPPAAAIVATYTRGQMDRMGDTTLSALRSRTGIARCTPAAIAADQPARPRRHHLGRQAGARIRSLSRSTRLDPAHRHRSPATAATRCRIIRHATIPVPPTGRCPPAFARNAAPATRRCPRWSRRHDPEAPWPCRDTSGKAFHEPVLVSCSG